MLHNYFKAVGMFAPMYARAYVQLRCHGNVYSAIADLPMRAKQLM
jgi:hypothetical protein